jgi:hypothetical protein
MSYKIEDWQVMQAHRNGAKIESTSRVHPKWVLTTKPEWNWQDNDYRIANLTADGMRLDEVAVRYPENIEVFFFGEQSVIGTMGGLVRTVCEYPEKIALFEIKEPVKEKKLRPWTMKEFEEHRDEWIIRKKDGLRFKITLYYANGVESGVLDASYDTLCKCFTLEDGSPCGVLE